MGMFKRIIRQTSNRLLRKLNSQRNSQRLVLNDPLGSARVGHGRRLLARGRSNGSSDKSKKHSKKLARDATNTCPEALLIAAKNYLPPVQFHHVHGPNVKLSANKLIAHRTQGFCQALVFSNRVILPNERVYIKVLEISKGWSGTIRFGFTSVDPATLRYSMPKHACPDMTNQGHTWARALADEVVRRNSVIHLSYNTDGCIHYGINNQDCGIFCANVNTSQNLWLIVDIYGLTAAVELIDPRIHNNARDVDFAQIDEELRMASERSPKYDGISGLDQFRVYDGVTSARALDSMVRLTGKKKRSKKSRNSSSLAPPTNLVAPELIYDAWAARNAHLSPSNLSQVPANLRGPAQFLPNLNSLALPVAQQNIYAPMPSSLSPECGLPPPASMPIHSFCDDDDSIHDYHQIITSDNLLSATTSQRRSTIPSQPISTAISSNNGSSINTHSVALNHPLMLETPLPARGRNVVVYRAGSARRHNDNQDDDDATRLCQQMDNLRFVELSPPDHHQSASKSTKSTKTSSSAVKTSPLAAATAACRSSKLQQSGLNSKRPSETTTKDRTKTNGISDKGHSAGTSLSKSSKGAHSSSASKAKARQTSRASCHTTRSSGTGDGSNSPQSKDCPICFERPINCVLYQCGHMCTCYECGVKQWKTQSRTCPICRTVIKDVIKTYLS